MIHLYYATEQQKLIMTEVKTTTRMINYSLFIKHFSDTATINEKSEFQSWLGASQDNIDYYHEMKKLWNEGRLLEHYQMFNKVVLYNYINKEMPTDN